MFQNLCVCAVCSLRNECVICSRMNCRHARLMGVLCLYLDMVISTQWSSVNDMYGVIWFYIECVYDLITV